MAGRREGGGRARRSEEAAVMVVEQRGPAVGNDSNKKEGKGEMIKAPVSLQDLRRSLYVKAKADKGWKRWKREWIYRVLGVYNDYGLRRSPLAKAAPVPDGV